jgi:hypothetical protein
MDIKQFDTWEETGKWMAKHGYGPTQIDLAKAAWDDKPKAKETAQKPAEIIQKPAIKQPTKITEVKTNKA